MPRTHLEDPTIQLLAQARPSDPRLSSEQTIRAEALFQRITSQSPTATKTAARRQPLWSTSRRPVLVGVTGALAIGITVASFVLPGQTPPAFASWTPVPTAVSAERTAVLAAACDITDALAKLPPDIAPDASAMVPVVVDVRGDYTIVVKSDGKSYAQCWLYTAEDGSIVNVGGGLGIHHETEDSQYGLLVSDGGWVTAGDQWGILESDIGRGGKLAVVSIGTSQWDGHDTVGAPFSLAIGRATDDVTAIEATLSTGEQVQATVNDGWWLLWTPGAASLPDEVTITSADGSQTQQSLLQESIRNYQDFFSDEVIITSENS